MLSRLATASRVSARALQAVRPGRQLLYTSSKAPTLVEVATSKEAFVPTMDADPKTIWQQYKDVAGESAGTVFVGSSAIYLLSKEFYVINAESYLLGAMALTLWLLLRSAQPGMQAWFENLRQEEIAKFTKEKDVKVANISADLVQIKAAEELLDTRAELFTAVSANNEMALEVQYRENLAEVEREVKKRLDYQLDLQALQAKIEHEHIAQWVTSEVVQSITPQQEAEAIAQCIAEIESLAVAQHA